MRESQIDSGCILHTYSYTLIQIQDPVTLLLPGPALHFSLLVARPFFAIFHFFIIFHFYISEFVNDPQANYFMKAQVQ